MLQPHFQKNINKILKITKNLIKTDDKFNKYMIKEDNQMIKEQFPVLIPNFLKKIKKKEEEKKLNLCRMNRSNSTVEYYFPKQNSMSNFQNFEDSRLQSARTFFKKNNNQINLNKILEKKHLKLCMKSNSELDIFSNSLILNDILIDSKKNLFKNNNYVIYNENEIFFKNYKERIEKSLEFIIKNYSNYKLNNIGEEPYNKIKLYKILHKDTIKQIEITINFVSIIIKSLEKNENTFYQNINLPIFFTPLFYINSEKNIPYILGSIFKEDNFLKLLINENFLNVIVNKDSFRNVNEDEYKKNYHKFKYLWVTENNSFEIEVTMPKIIINIKKTNTIIEKFIEDKLFFYLFCNEMKNWFDYIINYLFSYKKFRNIIDSITSKIIIKNKFENQKIILDEIRVKNQNFNEKKLVFLYTNNKSENFVFYFKPIVLNIPLNYNSKKKQIKFKKINFKIGELMFLVRTTNYFDDTLEFLLKFIEIEKEKNKCEFNFKKYNSIKEDFLKIIQKKISYQNINNNSNSSNNLIEITANELEKENKIGFIKDTIFKLKLINQSKNDFFSNKIRFEVKLNLLNNLSKNNNIFNWGKDLRDLLKELKEIKENLGLNKEISKRSSSIKYSKRLKSFRSNKSLIKFRQSSSIRSLKKE